MSDKYRVSSLDLPHGYSMQTNADTMVYGAKINGTLAGSLLSQQQALQNVMRWCGAGLDEILPALTSTPATLLGLTNRGRLAPGAAADLTVVNEAGEVKMVIVAGEILVGA